MLTGEEKCAIIYVVPNGTLLCCVRVQLADARHGAPLYPMRCVFYECDIEEMAQKSVHIYFYGGMAQSVEHIVHIDGVVGSSPTVTTSVRSF